MRKLAWAAGTFAAGVFAACYLLEDGVRIYAAAALFLIALLSFLLRGNTRKRVLLAACFAALGLAWTQVHYSAFIAPAQELDGAEPCAVFRVTDYPKRYDDYTLVSARLVTDGLPKTTVSLYDYDHNADDLKPGDLFEATVRLRSATQRYDEEIWTYTARGVYLTGTLRDAPRVTGQWSWRFVYFPKQLAKELKALIFRFLPADVSPLLTAMLTGDKTALYRNLKLSTAMQEAGLMHVVAVSGMHIAFLIGFLRLFTRKPRRTAALCIPIILIFIPMAGGSPSVIRAGLVQILILLAPLFRRESDSVTSLCTVLALLLAVNPQSAHSTSLLLSFAAMAGILLLSGRIYNALNVWAKDKLGVKSKAMKRLLHFVFSSLASTLGALAFTTPIMALTFGSVSLISPLTNLLTLGVVSVCFSLGLACCILGAALPFLGTALGWLLAWGLRYVIVVVEWLGKWRFACVYTVNPLVGVWLALVYIILILCWLLRGKRGFRPAVPVCAALCLLLAALAFTRVSDNRSALRFTALDVGQGQSLVLQNGNAAVVIDCGGPYSAGAGEKAANYVESRFLRGADALILTHLHADHANGVSELLYRVPVGTLILPADDSDEDGLLDEILRTAAETGTEVLFLDKDSLLTVGDMALTLYAPLGSGGSTNERGIVVSGSCGDFDFLVTGDVNAASERRLLRHAALPETELYVVGHHGSKHSTSEELLETIRPETAVISVGGNSFGHPTEEALSRLAEAGAKVYRTDHSGNITLRVPK